MEQNNYNKVSEIAGIHLGKVGGEGYKDVYDPSLLVRIPRILNREAYGIDENKLPFYGFDVWNAYEVSALTNKGLPVTGVLKIICPADTKYHVESKSIKLYLNSFNMTRMGETTQDCISSIENTVQTDLSTLLEGSIKVKMFRTADERSDYAWDFHTMGIENIERLVNLDDIEFNVFKSDASQLIPSDDGKQSLGVYLDFLRSNCRVTNQPDWGTLVIKMQGPEVPSYESLAKYVVSHRQVNHFHEEIVEMTYMHLKERFNPISLVVLALYTRRGGIDINPIRSLSPYDIPMLFHGTQILNKKTLMQ
jgi:7-cyano-7-deazaguanine reductase